MLRYWEHTAPEVAAGRDCACSRRPEVSFRAPKRRTCLQLPAPSSELRPPKQNVGDHGIHDRPHSRPRSAAAAGAAAAFADVAGAGGAHLGAAGHAERRVDRGAGEGLQELGARVSGCRGGLGGRGLVAVAGDRVGLGCLGVARRPTSTLLGRSLGARSLARDSVARECRARTRPRGVDQFGGGGAAGVDRLVASRCRGSAGAPRPSGCRGLSGSRSPGSPGPGDGTCSP